MAAGPPLAKELLSEHEGVGQECCSFSCPLSPPPSLALIHQQLLNLGNSYLPQRLDSLNTLKLGVTLS